MPLTAGATVDNKYVIRAVLGAGGYGIVYEATQIGLDRPIALKLLTDNIDAENVGRLMREAQVLSALNHRNLIQCFGHGTYNGAPYIAVEYVPGHSLQQELKAGQPIPCDRVLDLMTQICDGLACAHANGIVHRDLKPANILITAGPNGKELAKIIDFGLAKILPEATIQAKQQQLTDMGVAIGTVSYMSPEQCIGQPADARSDIYALGCILYECLTGHRPFDSDTAVATMFRHLNEGMPMLQPQQRNAASDELQKILQRAFAKDPDQRYQTAAEFESDLKAVAKHQELYKHNQAAEPSPPPVSAPQTAVAVQRKKVLKLVIVPVAISAVLSMVAVFAMQFKPNNSETALRAGDAALASGAFADAASHYRRALDDSSMDAKTKLQTEVRLTQAYFGADKWRDFVEEYTKLRQFDLNRAFELAQQDVRRYSVEQPHNERLLESAQGTMYAFCPSPNLSAGRYISSVSEFVMNVIDHHVLGSECSVIVAEMAQGYARKRVAERAQDYASISSALCMLRLWQGDYGATVRTTNDLFATLDRLSLEPEDRRVIQFCSNLYQLKLDDPNAMDPLAARQWMSIIAWACQYQELCGETRMAKQMCSRMAAWCTEHAPAYAAAFSSIPNRNYFAVHNFDAVSPPDSLAELPETKVQRACVISIAFQKAASLAEQKRYDESMAYFNAALDACDRINNLDLMMPYVSVLEQYRQEGVDPERAFAASDKYYRIAKKLGDDPIHLPAASYQRADLAFKLVYDHFTPENLQRAFDTAKDDLQDALASGYEESIANSYLRTARVYAVEGDADHVWEPWSRTFKYYSKHKPARLFEFNMQLADIAMKRNYRLFRLLRDDAECLVDGKILHITAADFQHWPSSKTEQEKLIFHTVPTADRMLQLHQFKEFTALKDAIIAVANRTGNSMVLLPLVQVAGTCYTVQQPQLGDEILAASEQFEKTHHTPMNFKFNISLSKAEIYNFSESLTAKDRGSPRAQKLETLYKQQLKDAEALVETSEQFPGRPLAVADAQFRLARVYATVGDTEHFKTLWNECLVPYRSFENKGVLNFRIAEMSGVLKDRGQSPQLAQQIRSGEKI